MKKTKQVMLIILCIGVFSAFAIGSGTTNEENSTATLVGEVSMPENTEETESVIEDSEPTIMQEDVKTEYYVGDMLSTDGLEITYTGSSNFISDNEYIQPAEGNKFIRLAFHVDNKSGSDKSISTYEFVCYADGYECQAIYQEDDLLATLSDGRTTSGAVYFEVPIDAKEIEIEYETNWISEEKVKFIFEGDKDSGLVFENDTTETENAFHVGDVIETDSLRISYIKAEEYKDDNMFLQPAEGMKYVYIELEVENLSDSDQMISYFSFNCYADGESCNGFYGMDDALSAELSAGRKAKGTIAFEVPIDAEVVEFEFEDNVWTESKIVFLYE